MADSEFEPPSFSLGLDLDLDSDPRPGPSLDPATTLRTINEEEDDDFESPIGPVPDQPRALKRLRRGPTSEPEKADDEIEDSSSDEEEWGRGILRTRSICSSSKSSLHSQRILTSESGSQWKSRKKDGAYSASTSANTETNGSNVIFPKLTVSPLRRFQLIDSDSDSDNPSAGEDPRKDLACENLSSKKNQSDSSKRAGLSDFGTKNSSTNKHQKEDLWKDFCSEKSFGIPTPAFDEICEEYFTSAKATTKAGLNCKDADNGSTWDVASAPPAHRYFFHKDSRIQKLVRDRLPNFFPLGESNNQEYNQQCASVIDYMGQFSNEEKSRKPDRKHSVEKSSSRARKNVGKSQADMSQDSKNWISPKSCAGPAKDAGKRRVQAVGTSAGHWYTGSDGRRVYVKQNGQELTGKIAYMQYKKESGKGFKNAKKKNTAKKKTAAKKKVGQKNK